MPLAPFPFSIPALDHCLSHCTFVVRPSLSSSLLRVSVCAVPGASHMKSQIYRTNRARLDPAMDGCRTGLFLPAQKTDPDRALGGNSKKSRSEGRESERGRQACDTQHPPAARSLALWLSLSLFRKLPIFPIRQKKNPAHSRFSIIVIPFTTTTSSSPLRSSTSSQLGARRRSGIPPPSTRSSLTALDVDESQRIPTTHLLAHARTTLSVPASASIRIAFV